MLIINALLVLIQETKEALRFFCVNQTVQKNE